MFFWYQLHFKHVMVFISTRHFRVLFNFMRRLMMGYHMYEEIHSWLTCPVSLCSRMLQIDLRASTITSWSGYSEAGKASFTTSLDASSVSSPPWPCTTKFLCYCRELISGWILFWCNIVLINKALNLLGESQSHWGGWGGW